MMAKNEPVGKTVTITPSMAKKLLDNQIGNRPLNPSRVIQYALAMEAGKWRNNGAPIILNDEGKMFDGQHRCEAAILGAGVGLDGNDPCMMLRDRIIRANKSHTSINRFSMLAYIIKTWNKRHAGGKGGVKLLEGESFPRVE